MDFKNELRNIDAFSQFVTYLFPSYLEVSQVLNKTIHENQHRKKDLMCTTEYKGLSTS